MTTRTRQSQRSAGSTGKPHRGRRFAVGCSLRYQASATCTVLLNVQVAASQRQVLLNESLNVEPHRPIAAWTEGETGNRFGRLKIAPGGGRLDYRAEAMLEPRPAPTGDEVEVADLPFEVLHYLRPSRYCPIEEITDFAHRSFGDGPVSLERAQAVCDWVAESLTYVPGISDTRTTAMHTLANRAGVCRDFAHLAIALLRALDIPSRYVTAYARGLAIPDFHAMVEAYCGNGWALFDPSGQAADPQEAVRIGSGYDAAEIPFATWFGNGQFTELDIICEPMQDAAR